MRAIANAAGFIALTITSCGSDASTAPAGTSSTSSGGSSGGTTTSSSGSTSGASSGGTTSSGGASTCPVRYCCSFDNDACAADRADLQAYEVAPEWLSQTLSLSPPGSMKLEAQGLNPVLDMGLDLIPKQPVTTRVEVSFSLRMETSSIAGVAMVSGGDGAFALVTEGASLWIYDSGKFLVGSLPVNAWNTVTLVIDVPAQTYSASVNGGAPVTRNMSDNNAAVMANVGGLRVGFTRTNGTTTAYYDDVRVDWP